MIYEEGLGYRSQRATDTFWERLGMEPEEAKIAAKCFPEAWDPAFDYWRGSRRIEKTPEEQAARFADDTVHWQDAEDPRHPAYWYAQGCDFDEMASRAVAAIAMEELQRKAIPPPPPPPKEDNVTQAMLAMGMGGSMVPEEGEEEEPDYSPPPEVKQLVVDRVTEPHTVPPDTGTIDLDDMPGFEIKPYEKRGRKKATRTAKKRQK